MRVIGVIDLRRGQAVHARRGERDRYQPVGDGDASTLAQTYLALGVRELYIADLDAILDGAMQDAVVSSLCRLGVPVWLDAGISSVDRARDAMRLGATHAVVGLETLTSYDALAAICADLRGDRVAFSLDLRNGRPIGTLGADDPDERLVARALAAGAGAIIVIDLSRIGAAAGVDVDLLARVRGAAPDRMLVAGGGVRGLDDLERLAAAGCDGALVATAVHAGRLGALEIEAASHFSVRR